MSRPSTSPGLLPVPGSAGASWPLFRARLTSFFRNTDTAVLIAFWLFGLINNVIYVIILSAAQDLVGDLPKGIVLLADVMPSFLTKLIAPYFIHRIPYALRIVIFVLLSSTGMLLIALTPPTDSVATKMIGVILSSLSSGGGELSFLGLTHYYGPMSLAAWGSGTGGAGLVGAGIYVVMTDWARWSVKTSLLVSACLPVGMLLSFFVVLPRGPLRKMGAKEYEAVPAGDTNEYEERVGDDLDVEELPAGAASSSLLAPGPSVAAAAYSAQHSDNRPGPRSSHHPSPSSRAPTSFLANLRRSRSLFVPYMLPLLLVYIAEYTINQGVAPTLLFPLASSPFTEYRAFYPFYGFLYQLGVFISRSSLSVARIHNLYIPSLLQCGNLGLLTLQALYDFIPSVWIVFGVVFWEGLLGGAVYVNTFAEIMERVPLEEREFSLGATSVSDSGGICVAGFFGMALEVALCDWQVRHGRDWCRRIKAG